MDDEYDITDLRQYINGRPLLINPPPLNSLPSHYDMLLLPSDCATTSAHNSLPTSNASPGLIGFDQQLYQNIHEGGGIISSGDQFNAINNGRWPRQETLTLLEVRSRLDYKFKEANLKGPLWDEVSRIMSEEYGYQRSGKKCREKFENLYKYYKKTKDQGKGTSKHDHGKRYRFFRQLEALCGESSNTNVPASISSEAHLNISGNFQYNHPNNYSNVPSSANNMSTSSAGYDTTSSDHIDGLYKKFNGDRNEKRIWKAKVKEFISEQMTRLLEKQEDWMEKMMITIENKEKERMMREEQWRSNDIERIERERKFWASERAWIEARDDTLVRAFEKFTGKELKLPQKEHVLRIADESGNSLSCHKKRKESLSTSFMFDHQNHDSIAQQGGGDICCDMNTEQGGVGHMISLNIHGDSSSLSASNNASNVMNDSSSFRFYTWDGYGRFMN